MSHSSYVDIITNGIKKKENGSRHAYSYSENVVVLDYNNVVHKGAKRAQEIEHKIFNKYECAFGKIVFNKINSKLVSCTYTIDFFEPSGIPSNLIERFTIKGVDMNKLIDDFNANGIDVNKLLEDFNKHNFSLNYIMEYLTKNNIEVSKIMTILYRNGATMTNLIKNPSINAMIKESSYAWFLKDQNVSVDNKKLTKRVNVFSVYNIKDEKNMNIQSIYWSLIK